MKNNKIVKGIISVFVLGVVLSPIASYAEFGGEGCSVGEKGKGDKTTEKMDKIFDEAGVTDEQREANKK